MAVSRRLRFEILRRDGMACRYCGSKAPDVQLTVDHVVPVALGGGDEPNNLVTACRDCNAGKSSIAADSALVEDVDAAALLFARAMNVAAQMRRDDFDLIDNEVNLFDGAWRRWQYDREPDGSGGKDVPRDDGWRVSVERWIELGLFAEDLIHFIPIAMKSKASVSETWRYFCGCVWRELSQRQELARRLIEDGQV